MTALIRIALGVEYAGTAFAGWQVQPNQCTVQGCVEAALSKIAAQPIKLYCAGRTDAGVHATGQVVHFDTTAIRLERAWLMGTNSYLPKNIAIKWVRQVDATFHARHSAIARSYRYIVCNTPTHSAIHADRASWYRYPLDASCMHTAAQCLLGERDFSAFRAAECDSLSPWRNMQAITVSRQENFVIIDVKANAFLHHMVRNIVGSLFMVGAGRRDAAWLADVLAQCDRRRAAETAPAAGLYLVAVQYPPPWHFPVSSEHAPTMKPW
jgi:tRNA pseudouridine38-40 synthase